MTTLLEFTRRLKGLPSPRPVVEQLAYNRPGADRYTYFGDGDNFGNGRGDSVETVFQYEEDPSTAYFIY